jgi:hypothetical protein
MSVAEVEAASHQSREPSVRASKLHELSSNSKLHFHHGEEETIRVHERDSSSPPSRPRSRSPPDTASELTANNPSPCACFIFLPYFPYFLYDFPILPSLFAVKACSRHPHQWFMRTGWNTTKRGIVIYRACGQPR